MLLSIHCCHLHHPNSPWPHPAFPFRYISCALFWPPCQSTSFVLKYGTAPRHILAVDPCEIALWCVNRTRRDLGIRAAELESSVPTKIVDCEKAVIWRVTVSRTTTCSRNKLHSYGVFPVSNGSDHRILCWHRSRGQRSHYKQTLCNLRFRNAMRVHHSI